MIFDTLTPVYKVSAGSRICSEVEEEVVKEHLGHSEFRWTFEFYLTNRSIRYEVNSRRAKASITPGSITAHNESSTENQ